MVVQPTVQHQGHQRHSVTGRTRRSPRRDRSRRAPSPRITFRNNQLRSKPCRRHPATPRGGLQRPQPALRLPDISSLGGRLDLEALRSQPAQVAGHLARLRARGRSIQGTCRRGVRCATDQDHLSVVQVRLASFQPADRRRGVVAARSVLERGFEQIGRDFVSVLPLRGEFGIVIFQSYMAERPTPIEAAASATL